MVHATRRLVGRDEERRRLEAVVSGVREGGSRVLVLLGEPGSGKTSLLDLLDRPAAGLCCLRATGVEGEGELPFAGLDALLRPLLHLRDGLPEAQAAALERALALGPGGPADHFAIGAATLSLLAAAAEDAPVLCVVDDLQALDRPSRGALLFAARRLDREPVGIVLAARPEREIAEQLRGMEILRLGRLEDAAARELLAGVSGGRIPGELCEQLVAAADGNPLALVELATRVAPAELEGREASVGPPPPSASAEELLAGRVRALAEPARRALLVLATCEREDVAALEAALHAFGGSLEDLHDAEAAGLVELRSGRARVAHPLARSVAYHLHPPDVRRAAHAAVAAALPAGDPRRPWHLAAAAERPDEAIAAELEATARDARHRGGVASAARAQRRAADLTPAPRLRAARLVAAAEAYELAGLADEADTVLREASEAAPDAESLARVRAEQAHVLLRQGHPATARPLLLRQAEVLAAADPRRAARCLVESAFAAMVVGDVDALRGESARALELAGRDGGATGDRRLAAALHAAALIAAGEAESALPLLEAAAGGLDALELEPGVVVGAVDAYAFFAHTLAWIEQWEAAERFVAAILGRAREQAAVAALPFLLAVEAVVDFRRGRWNRAAATVSEAVTIAEATGVRSHLAGSLGIRAVISGGRGDRAALEADAARALELAGEAAPRLVVHAHHGLGLHALSRGDVEAARDHLGAAVEAHATTGFAEPGAEYWHADHVEALIRCGEEAEAARRLDAWEAAGARHGRRFVLATAARCRGLLAPDEEVDAAFATALEHHAALPLPFERARTLLCHGERLRRARRRADARSPLRDALATFDELGASEWAARARGELRATGGTVPAAARPEVSELTPHEIQVALLVAEGRTNREVAATLFLAPKTIEHHLGTIFRKLGIKRRAELARVFADELAGRAGTA
jgi:DNA-binding CsgD family transcriptional regulator